MKSFNYDNKQILDAVGRTTAFTVVYWLQSDDIDSEKSFLFKFLSSCGVPCCCSPLHDEDINELETSSGDVEFKKAHFHLVFDFGSGQNKTVKQCFELIEAIRDYISIAPFDKFVSFDEFDFLDHEFEIFSPDTVYDNFARCCQVWKKGNVVRNMRSLLRYFCHLDNPEKFQYDTQDLRSFNGFNIEDRLYSQSDSVVILDDILDYIESNQIYSFWELVNYCRKNNREWFSVLIRRDISGFVRDCIKSFTYDDTGALSSQVKRYEKSCFDESSAYKK